MLSQKTIDIVKSTVPVLEVHGNEITKAFYKNMFETHPQLLNIFNQANQQKGRQQTALANTVYAAAQYIDQLEVLLPAVKQIAHKHRSLVVKPEHYPIVGEHLLKAIKEVLGDAATDEIIDAWGEAYGVIADVFISVEQEMYDQAGSEAGWAEYKTFNVVKKVKESDNITSFYLKAADGTKTPNFAPGQYITVRVNIPGEEYLLNRQYSLTSKPGDEYFRISVKRERLEGLPDGKVSNYLHDHLNEGDTIEVTAPAGDFTIDVNDSKPVYFIAGGVGITPFMSMLQATASSNPERKVSVLHAMKNPSLQPFANELMEMKKTLANLETSYFFDEVDTENTPTFSYKMGRIQLQDVNELNQEGVFYVCGPVPFMKSMVNELTQLGIASEQIHYEFFGPAMNIEQ
ncbi:MULTISPECIES: NO-inducible flavohemoprotein [Bacillus]|uniref:NO-inducible flavohemoprotein n=1 Tax=Bacillus TaxID=1386 RepID=UPI0002EB71C2|nr:MULTISPECIES: NO-inducible flavohemoprotein [Bacillus]